MTGYYDVVLGLIPVALIGITVALTVVGIPLFTAVPVGAVVAIALIGHAMFVNNPVDIEETSQVQQTQNSQVPQSPVNLD